MRGMPLPAQGVMVMDMESKLTAIALAGAALLLLTTVIEPPSEEAHLFWIL